MKSFALLLALLPLAASAATITVNTTADNTTAGDGKCTLREAIANANAAANTTGGDCTAGSGAGDTITFSVPLPAIVRLTPKLSELVIAKDLTIAGPGAGSLAIDGRNQTRVFHITAGSTSMSDLTIRKGRSNFMSDGKGGGILVDAGAALDLSNCELLRNKATNLGGSISGGAATGGGIEVAGALTLTNCTVSGNSAISHGDRHADDGYAVGGGLNIEANATATLTHCTLNANRALGTGSVYGNGNGGVGNGGLGVGGGIATQGTATLTDCTLSANLAISTGSGESGGISLGGGVDIEAAATLIDCTLIGNNARSIGAAGFAAGGGVEILGADVSFTDCTFTDNRAAGGGYGAYGGGMDVAGSATTLANCTFSGNTAIGYGHGSNGYGGGIDIEPDARAMLANCTFTSNRALGYGGDFETFATGGGIEIDGTAALTNCTLRGNTVAGGANGGEGGGGVAVGGIATLTNCTLSGNKVTGRGASRSGEGGGIASGDRATLTNTIVTDSGSAGDCGTVPVTSAGHNLSSDDTCFTSGGTDLVNTKPHLAPLANNGGPTQTMALCTAPGVPHKSCTAASPAIDAGDDSVTGPPDNLTTDQRGLPRLSGAHVDIGAYEVQ